MSLKHFSTMASDAAKREARRQKILARGSDRLASITGHKPSVAAREEASERATIASPDEARESLVFDEGPTHSRPVVLEDAGFVQFAKLAQSLLGEQRGEASSQPQSAPVRSQLLSRLTGQALSALEEALRATDTARLCCSILFAVVVFFAYYVHRCVDSTLVEASPVPQPLLVLASLNGTIVLGWCFHRFFLRKGEGIEEPEEAFGVAGGFLKWLGRANLAVQVYSLASKIVSTALRDGSFFLITFSFFWTVYLSLPQTFCPLDLDAPT